MRPGTPSNTGSSASGVSSATLKSRAEACGMQFLEDVSPDALDPLMVQDLPVEWARAHHVLPVRIGGRESVLLSDPSQIEEQEYMEILLGRELQAVVAPESVVTKCIEKCYYSRKDSPDDFLRGLGLEDGVSAVSASTGRSDDLLRVASEAPVTQLLNLILLEAVRSGASDIHFEPFESRLRVRHRVDGVLYERSAPPRHLVDALVSRVKVMAHMDIAEKRLPQDGMAKVSVGDRQIDIRVSTVPVPEGERVVLRILDKESTRLSMDVLGMSQGCLDSFQVLLKSSSGIIVVSGPTGCGKTTTLYAALGCLDAVRKNILTIEDPVEYELPDIGQIQVKPKIGLTFANGLRHILRQDPDIVLVGETRDIETAEIAVRASLTGHLVFTTLHTNDAPGAVLRLIDMGVEPYLLASCLRGVLAQRLVRRLCEECRSEQRAADRDASRLGLATRDFKGKKIWKSVGCDQCLEGYHGRVGLFELMSVGPRIRELIRSGGARADDLRGVARSEGMISLREDGINKALAGETSVDEVVSVTEQDSST